jgi:hypothetical protein
MVWLLDRKKGHGIAPLAQQWEVLCPGPVKVARAADATAAPQRAPRAPAAQFSETRQCGRDGPRTDARRTVEEDKVHGTS